MRFGVAAAAVLLSTALAAGSASAQQAASAPLDPAAVARGDALFKSNNCSVCHGVLGAGGANNAADLTRSRLAQTADGGRTLYSFLLAGKPDTGMPAFPGLTPEQGADLSAKIRSLAPQAAAPAAGGGRAAGPPLPAALAGQDLSIVIGDPKAGKAFFNGAGKCSTCHAVEDGKTSPAANLAHVATKFKAEKELQNTWILPRVQNWSPRKDNNVTATAVYADGRKVSGFLTSVSDFKLVIRDAAGATQTIPRAKGEPKVELVDRLQGHLDLLQTYQDNDIHNITAYLATLK